jgi:hypothetical protein
LKTAEERLLVYQTWASYYRVALLLGLVGGEVVHEWATQAIERDASPPLSIIDLALIPTSDLTELRHALWTLAGEPEPPQVLPGGCRNGPPHVG